MCLLIFLHSFSVYVYCAALCALNWRWW